MARSLGLDVGDRRIGLALSDQMGVLATPLAVIDRVDEEAALAVILDIITRNQVGQIIVGLPRSMSGDEGPQAEKVRSFAQELSCRTDVPLDFRDERLSTVSARRLMRGSGKPKQAADDAIAAAFILQSYLDEAY